MLLSHMLHFIAIGEFKLEIQCGNTQFRSKYGIFVLRELELWRMTLKNNRATPLCHLKHCTSFCNHQWFQTRVKVRKSQNWDKNCFNLHDLDLWTLTLTVCMDITSLNGNYSWKLHGGTIAGTLWKKVSQTDSQRQSYGQTDGLNCS